MELCWVSYHVMTAPPKRPNTCRMQTQDKVKEALNQGVGYLHKQPVIFIRIPRRLPSFSVLQP